MKTITFLIQAGHYLANNMFRFRFLFTNSVTFTFSVSYAAFYNYLNVVNCWHKIIGFSDFPLLGNSANLIFINSTSGLKAAFSFYSNGQVQPPVNTADNKFFSILPNTSYTVTVTRNKDSYEVLFHDKESRSTIFSMMPGRFCNALYVSHPGLGGLFTLDNDLIITIEHLKN